MPEKTEFQNIKTNQITENQLKELKEKAGSFEKLFNRRSLKYREFELSQKKLTEEDYKKLILQEYTFLKRPVFLFPDRIFIGDQLKALEQLSDYLNQQAPQCR